MIIKPNSAAKLLINGEEIPVTITDVKIRGSELQRIEIGLYAELWVDLKRPSEVRPYVSRRDTVVCWECKRTGFAIDEFVSSYNGLCADCNKKHVADSLITLLHGRDCCCTGCVHDRTILKEKQK